MSIHNKTLGCAKLLVQNGANYNVSDSYGNTSAHYAAFCGNDKHLDYLKTELNFNMSVKNGKGQTIYEIAHNSIKDWVEANDPTSISAN